MIITLPSREARDAVYNDHEDFKVVTKDLVDNSRWSLIYETVLKRISDGKFYSTSYRVGATESQDERPFEYEDEVEFTEVEPVETVVITYQPVK